MERSIFAFIRRYSLRQQMLILALSALLLPISYALLELPKLIINRALGDNPSPTFFSWDFDQLELLWTLCGIFLVMVVIQGGVKYVVNVYAGVVAERELRRLRYQLYNHVLRFPLPHFKRVSQAELVQMINAEVEPLGGFINAAVSTPGVQGGTLLVSLVFMFMQDPILGFAAIALYPLQIWLIPKLQAVVNQLGKQRVRQVRRNAEKIGEMASGVRDIRANDITLYESAKFSRELGRVFDLRFEIYKKKFVIKFINNFLAQLGPFFFYSIGGYLVLQGDITIGALVAVIGAQKDIASPWKELLSFYQLTYDVKIKYEQVVAQFVPPQLHDQHRLSDDPPQNAPAYENELRLNHLSLSSDDGETILDGISTQIDLPAAVAVVGAAGAGKEELLQCIANLLQPTGGRVQFDGIAIENLPDSVTGRRSAFVGNPAQFFAGSIKDNLLYGIKYRPIATCDRVGDRDNYLLEAQRSGNSPYFPDDEWVAFESLGLDGEDDQREAMIDALRVTALTDEVYTMGLRNTLNELTDSDLVERLLIARRALQERLNDDPNMSRLVEQFDPKKYNENATIAENLLFGTPLGHVFDVDHLADHVYVQKILEETGLTEELLSVGYQLASTMIELFADLPPDHEYFRQFSFIDAEDLPFYKALIGRVAPNSLETLSADERRRLLDLPFKLIPARHRLGMISDELTAKILQARARFSAELPGDLNEAIEFFDPSRWNHASSIQDNLLFGKIAYGQAQASTKVSSLITDLLRELGLTEPVIEIGMRTECGAGGSRLTATQRQKLGLARAIMKQPQVLIVSDATGPLDHAEAQLVRDNVLAQFQGRSVIWAARDPEWASVFDRVLVLDTGRLAESGSFAELMEKQEGALKRLFG